MKKKKNRKPGSEGDMLPVNVPSRKPLIDKQGAEYLRESGNIEDLPTPEQVDRIKEEKRRKRGK